MLLASISASFWPLIGKLKTRLIRLYLPLPTCPPPTWHATLAREQYAGTRAADAAERTARYAARANAPPHHLEQAITLNN